MNAWVLLTMPWTGLRSGLRGAWALFTLACWGGAAVLIFAGPAMVDHSWQLATGLMAFWLVSMSLLLSSVLLLALEARVLCLPHLERAAAYSLLLNLLLLLVNVVLPMALMSGHPRPVGQILLIGLAAGFTYALVPAIWILPLLLGLPLLLSLGQQWHWQPMGPQDPHFLWITAAIVLLAVLSSVWSWQRVLRQGTQSIGWRRRPIILDLRLGAQCAATDPVVGDPHNYLARRTPAWLQPRAQLGAGGPADLPRALRILLGGVYLPVTLRSVVRQLALPGAILLAMVLLQAPALAHDGWRWTRLRPLVMNVASAGVGMLVMALMVKRSKQLVSHWRRPGGVLTVLPLLPGFGDGAQQTARLLRMLFAQMCVWGLPLIGVAFLVTVIGTHSLARGALLLMVLGLAPAAEVAVVYSILGRRPVPAGVIWVLAVLGFALVLTAMDVAILAGRMILSGPLPAMVLVGCALGYAVSIGLAARGRRALQRQPHPYLALD